MRKTPRDRIATDPNVMLGKPCIRGTSITVETVLKSLAAGASADGVVLSHPQLAVEDVYAAIAFAARKLAFIWKREQRAHRVGLRRGTIAVSGNHALADR